MFKAVNIVGAFVLLFSQATSMKLLPTEKCSLQDSPCLTTQASMLLKAFVEGIPDLGIEKLDKVSVGTIEIKKDNFNLETTNTEVAGLMNSVIDKISIDMDLHIIKLSFRTTLTFTADYSVEGLLFTFPVNGRGRVTVVHNDMDFEMLILFDIVKKDGNDVMDLKTYRFAFDSVGITHFNFENIINSDQKRSEQINTAINEYWRTVTGHFGYVPLNSVMQKIFDATKTYLGSVNLEDIATY